MNMPVIYTTHLVDANGCSVLAVMSRDEPPGTETAEALKDTVERFGLEVHDITVAREVACRGCGCTDERACPGGCEWVPGGADLCSRCELAESVKPRALVLP
jgi:hypothetical protein